MNVPLLGIHHITAIAGDPARNLHFYRDVLGLRLVKRTVNFDDPSTYHFYFGDEAGTPGTILTFFPWAGAPAGRAGAGMIEAVGFAVPHGSLAFWGERLTAAGVAHAARHPLFGEAGLAFADPDGLRLELVEGEPGAAMRQATGVVPAEKAIARFHSARTRLRDGAGPGKFLREQLDFQRVAEQADVQRYRTAGVGAGWYDLAIDPAARPAVPGRGTVHHIAWATADIDASLAWRERLVGTGVAASPVMERKYFRSVYFREPGGVLFELATRGPGFAVDEPADSLGATLQLPEGLEKHREEIEAVLPALAG